MHYIFKPKCVFIGDKLQYILKRNNSFEVHSSFRSTINLYNDNNFFTITKKKELVHPYSIILCDYERVPSLTSKDKVFLEPEIDKQEEYVPYSMNNSKNKLCNLEKRLEQMTMLLNEESNYLTHLISVFPYIEELQQAILSKEKPMIIQALDKLIGNGLGLTPSGDDVIIGILAINTTINMLGYKKYKMISKEYFCNKANLTNKISWEVMNHAINGNFLFVLLEFCYLVLTNDDQEKISLAFKNLTKIGHTSGYDLAVGVLIGLSCLVKGGNNLEQIYQVSL